MSRLYSPGKGRQPAPLLEKRVLLYQPSPYPKQIDQVETLPHHGELGLITDFD